MLQLLKKSSENIPPKEVNCTVDHSRTTKSIETDIERLKQEQKQLAEREKVETENNALIAALRKTFAEEKKTEESLTQEVSELKKTLNEKRQILRRQQAKVEQTLVELYMKLQGVETIRVGDAQASTPVFTPTPNSSSEATTSSLEFEEEKVSTNSPVVQGHPRVLRRTSGTPVLVRPIPIPRRRANLGRQCSRITASPTSPKSPDSPESPGFIARKAHIDGCKARCETRGLTYARMRSPSPRRKRSTPPLTTKR